MLAPAAATLRPRRSPPCGAAGRVLAFFAAALTLITLALAPARALAAFTPPPLTGHVVDTAGKLSAAEIGRLDQKLAAIRQQTGFEIVAFVAGSLEGETIEDVAYRTFNTWQIGRERLDNGVLLVIAPAERRIRIETGKGVGGALTDLESNDIIRQQITPLLQQDRFYEAIDRGSAAIAGALTEGTPEGAPRAPPEAIDPVKVGLSAGAIVLIIILSIISPTFRGILWIVLHMLLFRGGGGGGGGSGYRGGGGRSGGGGSSDSY